MNKIYKSAQKKISNSIRFNEYVYFKRQYHNSIVSIDTGIFKDVELSVDLPKKYPFLNNLEPKQLKSINSLELERVVIKTVCNHLDYIFRNKEDETGNIISYRQARKNIEKDLTSIVSYIFSLKNGKTIPTFKSFFKSDEQFHTVISRLKSNGILNENQEFKNYGATELAILICKLIDLNYLKNIHRKKEKLAEALMNTFSLKFHPSHFSKVIKEFEKEDLHHDPKHEKIFNSLDFLAK